MNSVANSHAKDCCLQKMWRSGEELTRQAFVVDVGGWGAHDVAGRAQKAEIIRADECVSPARVQRRDCGSSPTSFVPGGWCWLPLSPWMGSQAGSLWLGGGGRADQWQGGGRSWGWRGRGLGWRKEGLYVTVENTKGRWAHAFNVFVLLLSLVPRLPFLLRPFGATFRVSWRQLSC